MGAMSCEQDCERDCEGKPLGLGTDAPAKCSEQRAYPPLAGGEDISPVQTVSSPARTPTVGTLEEPIQRQLYSHM